MRGERLFWVAYINLLIRGAKVKRQNYFYEIYGLCTKCLKKIFQPSLLEHTGTFSTARTKRRTGSTRRRSPTSARRTWPSRPWSAPTSLSTSPSPMDSYTMSPPIVKLMGKKSCCHILFMHAFIAITFPFQHFKPPKYKGCIPEELGLVVVRNVGSSTRRRLTSILVTLSFGLLCTECARDRDLYKLVSCRKFVNEILFLYHL